MKTAVNRAVAAYFRQPSLNSVVEVQRWKEQLFPEFTSAVRGRYSGEALLEWTDWCLEQSQLGRSAWCYFNNDIHGHAIDDAQTLKSIVGQLNR